MAEYWIQVLMWNPADFPQQPEQWTPGALVQVLANGTVKTRKFGKGTGMDIWPEVFENEEGEPMIRFPFSIPGF